MCLSVRHGPGCSPDAIRDLDTVPPSLHSNLGQAMTALIGAFINVQIIRDLTLLREAIAVLRGSGPAGTRKRLALMPTMGDRTRDVEGTRGSVSIVSGDRRINHK